MMNRSLNARSSRTRRGSVLLLTWLTAVAAIALTAILSNTGSNSVQAQTLPELRVSANNRYLVKADGSPFFYLGDTAWELFHRLNRQEAVQYLNNRAALKYNVVQAVALAELNGLNEPNAHDDRPLLNNNPSTPAVTNGANPNDAAQYDYWDHVDYIVNEAATRGIYTAMLPTWGVHVTSDYSNGQVNGVFNTSNAQAYGEFLGRRYANKPIIWVIGGDRTPSTDAARAVWRALAKGIAIGVAGSEDYSRVLMTFHPPGGRTSSTWFHNDAWLDFNMQQNGHCANTDVWNRISSDYNRSPVKPVLDGEPLYEDHPICFNAGANGYSNDYEIRKFAYWDVFAGAFGHTYGDHSIWQMHSPNRGGGVNGPISYWYDAINAPGGGQMQYLRNLMESRPFLTRLPDQSVLASDDGSGTNRVQATRDSNGSYLFVYSASGQPFSVNMNRISGSTVKAWWYNPRTGTASEFGTFSNTGTQTFVPPSSGAGNDWVLVLDDQAQGFNAPGGNTSTPPTGNLVKAVNVNGGAVTIDGVAFQAESASGLTVSGGSRFADQNAQLTPTTDAARLQMIRSSIWNSSGQMNVNLPIANGSYNVYLYTWEDNFSMDFQLVFEGAAQGGTQSTGATNTWKRLGPYSVTVTDGGLTINVTGGHFMLSGIEVYQADTNPPGLIKAVNVNGGAVTIDGVAFQAESASGLTVSGGSRFADQNASLTPATDAARAQMIRSSIWNSSGQMAVELPIANGSYQVYLYTWEDNFSMDFQLVFEGAAQGGTQSTGATNTWKRLGPYTANVSDGRLSITVTGGHFMLSGIEVHQ